MNKTIYINIILVLSSIIILVYVGLIPLGHWQTDEYQTALAIKNGGLDALKNRIATWSPRPLSESLLFIYLDFVNRAKNQFITPVLGLFWLMLISCTVMPVIIKSRNAKYPTSKMLIIPMSLMGMYLLNHPVAEFFYWPMATIAYMPVLAAISLIFIATEISNQDATITRQIILWSLLVASTSAEVGAMFTVIYTVVALFVSFYQKRKTPHFVVPYWLIIPLLASIGILYRLVQGRVAANTELFGKVEYLHHFLPSAIAALPHSLWALASSDDLDISAIFLIFGLVQKLAFFVGVFLFSANEIKRKDNNSARLVLIITTLSITPITLFLAYYQFGTMACCERHDTFRQCLVFVGLASAASLLASLNLNASPLKKLISKESSAYGFLLLAIFVGLAGSVKNIKSDYSHYRDLLTIHRDNWNSGIAPSDSMIQVQSTYGHIVGGYPVLDEKSYLASSKTPHDVKVLLDYFEKKNVTFKKYLPPLSGE